MNQTSEVSFEILNQTSEVSFEILYQTGDVSFEILDQTVEESFEILIQTGKEISFDGDIETFCEVKVAALELYGLNKQSKNYVLSCVDVVEEDHYKVFIGRDIAPKVFNKNSVEVFDDAVKECVNNVIMLMDKDVVIVFDVVIKAWRGVWHD